MKHILTNKFTKKKILEKNCVAIVVLLTAVFMIFQVFSLSASASDIFSLNQREYEAFSKIVDTEALDPAALPPNNSLQVGAVAWAYWYRVTPTFPNITENCVASTNGTYAKLSLNPSTSFDASINVPFVSNGSGLGNSPNIYIMGIAPVNNLIIDLTCPNSTTVPAVWDILPAPPPPTWCSSPTAPCDFTVGVPELFNLTYEGGIPNSTITSTLYIPYDNLNNKKSNVVGISSSSAGPFTTLTTAGTWWMTFPITLDSAGNGRSADLYLKGLTPISNLNMTVSYSNSLAIKQIYFNLVPPPPSPRLELAVGFNSLAVGSVDSFTVEALDGTHNIATSIRVRSNSSSSNDPEIGLSLNSSGPFSFSLDVPVQLDSAGHGRTATIYAKGQKTDSDNNYIRASSLINEFPTKDSNPIDVVNVSSLMFESMAGNVSLNNNPNAGGGLRIYADKNLPGESAFITEVRKQVKVTAQLSSPKAGVQINFLLFDVDDPSSDESTVDPTRSAGNDNRGGGFRLSSTSAMTDSEGKASVILRVSKQPGDNFKVAATCNGHPGVALNNYLNGITNDRITLYDNVGIPLPIQTASSTNIGVSTSMLTVWRRLHIERDSMGAVTGNFVTGQITGITPGTPSRLVVTVPPAYSSALQKGRFEGGRILIYQEDVIKSGVYYKVTNNGTNAVYVEGNLVAIMAGWQFKMWDDDDFNSNDGENLDGDTGEDIPAPDMSLLQDSDDPALNKMAPAYIRPKYDLTGESPIVPFVANIPNADPTDPTPTNAEIESLFRFDNIATETDPNFWTVYALNAYQDTTQADLDPVSEGTVNHYAPLGRTDGGDGQGIIIFLETIHDFHNYLTSTGQPIDDRYKANAIAAHEVAHLFGGLDSDGGIMTISCTSNCLDYSPITLNKIRNRSHP